MMNRKIIHVDMDAFFASVEQRDDVSLRGKPIAVGFDGPRGVVSTASYEARRYGVRSAMSMAKAKRLCPELVVVPSHYEHYKEVSRCVHDIFREYTDIIEPLSLDEAFLDVTENKSGAELATDIAREIRCKIRDRLALTASAGVGGSQARRYVCDTSRQGDGLYCRHEDRGFLGRGSQDGTADAPHGDIYGHAAEAVLVATSY